MKQIYDQVALSCSRLTTHTYSTSFSLGIKFLDPAIRNPICSIYGFVRFADEIVDTFHDHDKAALLTKFKADTYEAIDQQISLNPILHSFQLAVNEYGIGRKLIDQFLYSMEMDLKERTYDQDDYEQYILGSAEVVGLMCLKVFCIGNQDQYEVLRPFAMKLGAAFQKINFLRDLKEDYKTMGRSYFPGIELSDFNEHQKRQIELEIEEDFKIGLAGIKKLPRRAKFGVYLAYVYYYALFNKIRRTPSSHVLSKRIRIANPWKFVILIKTYLRHRLRLI